MENPIKMDDLGGKPTIFSETPMVGFFVWHHDGQHKKSSQISQVQGRRWNRRLDGSCRKKKTTNW